MSAPAVHPESFPNLPEKRERSNLGLVLAGIGLGVAACGVALASLDNLQGQKRWPARPIGSGFVDALSDDQPVRSANLFIPGFDYSDIEGTARVLAPYISDTGPVGFIDNNTGAFSSEQTTADALAFAQAYNLEQANIIGLSAGGMTATEVAVTFGKAGIKTNLFYLCAPYSAKDIYFFQRIPLKAAALWSKTGINFGPQTRLLYESIRLSYEMGFGRRALQRAIEVTYDERTSPNTSIFGRADNIYAHKPSQTYQQLNPETRAVDIFANRLHGDGTIKNRQAVQSRKAVLGDRHYELAVDGVGHVDIEDNLELWGQALRQAYQLLGICAISAIVAPPLAELPESVELVVPSLEAA